MRFSYIFPVYFPMSFPVDSGGAMKLSNICKTYTYWQFGMGAHGQSLRVVSFIHSLVRTVRL